MKGFGILEFGGAEQMSEQDIIDLSGKAIGEAKAADAVLISCGGLMTLNCAVPIEDKLRHPGGDQHAVGVLGGAAARRRRAARSPGYGRMLGQSGPAHA